MERGNDDIEASERLVVEIERAVSVYLDLGARQKCHAGFAVCFVDFDSLKTESFGIEPARDGQTVTVIGDSQQAIAACSRRVRHLSHRGGAVAPCGVSMELATDVSEGHKRRYLCCTLELFASRPELGGDERMLESRVNLLFSCGFLRNGPYPLEVCCTPVRPKQSRPPGLRARQIDVR